MKKKLLIYIILTLVVSALLICTSCNNTSNGENENKEHTHIEETIQAKAPTCTEEGLTEGKKCSICDEILLEQEKINSLGHSFDNNYKCEKCSFTKKVSQGLEFALNFSKTGYDVIGIGSCEDEHLVIPFEYEGLPVVGIIDQALYFQEQLKSVTIPNSVTKISPYSLACNINIEEFIIGENNQSYKTIDGNIYTKDGETLVQYACGKKDTEFILPKGVKTIAPYSLYGVMCLEHIDFGTELTTISDYAASMCPSLKTIVIPEQVEYIGEYSFFYSTGATSIVIKSKNVEIGERAFGRSFKLVEIYNLSGVDLTSNLDENSKIGSPVIMHTSLNEKSVMETEGEFVFTINDSKVYLVDYIGNEANVVLPQSYKGNSYIINRGAFYMNSKIESVIIPKGVTAIGEHAFQECYSLKYIEIADSVDTIGDRAFCIGESLGKIVIGNSASNVDSRAFDNCETAEVFVKGENKGNALDELLNEKTARVYYFSEKEPTQDGNYWHYVDGTVTAWN